MTKKQRVALWRRMSQCFDRHERAMIKEQKKKMKSRIDIIGQNGILENITKNSTAVIGGGLLMIGKMKILSQN